MSDIGSDIEFDDAYEQQDVNILLLGETGVGKSTFINSVANYLTYRDMKTAASEKLLILIPTSFMTYDKHKNKHIVNVGPKDHNEFLETGISGTQDVKTYVFPICNGRVKVRLIDTPGMGDTRGIKQDDINSENILSYIGQLKELHAICFLFKPNQSRQTVFFHYCMAQIFSRLDKSASRNVVFVFTNSRGTDYSGGDTLNVLEKVVGDIKKRPPHVEIPLDRNVFCFDNEAFRYLAAVQEGVEYPAKVRDYNDESWNNSSTECWNLIHYILGDGIHPPLKPHNIQSTTAINEARRMIRQLCQPLAEISQLIGHNMNILQRHKENLQVENQSMKELKIQLFMPVISLEVIELTEPVTVCTNRECAEIYQVMSREIETLNAGRTQACLFSKKADPSLANIQMSGVRSVIICHGKTMSDRSLKVGGRSKWHYKQRCHEPCYLQNVPKEIIGSPELVNCAAMNREGVCNECNCNFQVHMHVYFMTETKEVKEKDSNIEQNINSKEEIMDNVRKLIKNMETKKEELDSEHHMIITTSARFAYFLQNNAITPFSDSYKEYIEYLITQEKSLGKLCNKDTLDHLRKLLREYEEANASFDEILKKSNTSSDVENVITPEEVNESIRVLFKLKHNGKKIRELFECQEKSRKKEYDNTEYIHSAPVKKDAKMSKKNKRNVTVKGKNNPTPRNGQNQNKHPPKSKSTKYSSNEERVGGKTSQTRRNGRRQTKHLPKPEPRENLSDEEQTSIEEDSDEESDVYSEKETSDSKTQQPEKKIGWLTYFKNKLLLR